MFCRITRKTEESFYYNTYFVYILSFFEESNDITDKIENTVARYKLE